MFLKDEDGIDEASPKLERLPDTTRAQTELGLSQFINLESAIRKTLTYARFDTGSQAMVEAVEPMKTDEM